MGNYLPAPEENEAVDIEVASNYEESEESDNEVNEPVPVEIHNEYSPFVKELSSDDFRAEIEQFWMNSHSIEVARKAGVDSIQQKCNNLGFRPQTAYLAVTYLTRFLSITREFEVNEAHYSWFIKELMSAACLSLSAKMEEVVVPTLSSFCDDEPNTFSNETILKMEQCVLNKLLWDMDLITPFAFTGFFAEKLTEIFAMRIVSARVEYAILRSMKDVKTLCYRPSMVALVATLVAVEDYNTSMTISAMRLRIQPFAYELDMNIGEITACYIRVRGMVEPRITGHLGRTRIYQCNLARARGVENMEYYTDRI